MVVNKEAKHQNDAVLEGEMKMTNCKRRWMLLLVISKQVGAERGISDCLTSNFNVLSEEVCS